jgi:hypothetical protein
MPEQKRGFRVFRGHPAPVGLGTGWEVARFFDIHLLPPVADLRPGGVLWCRILKEGVHDI